MVFSRLAVVIGVLISIAAPTVAQALQEFPPPQGKGRVVVLASGMSGPEHYVTVAGEIARLGYDVMLFDGNAMEGTHGDGVKTAIQQAQQLPHALPGKVALVGFSLGGGMCLYYGTQWPDLVTGAVVWYPATTFIRDVPGLISRLKVPVLMFAGEDDTFRGCCLVTRHAPWRWRQPEVACRSSRSPTRIPSTTSSSVAATTIPNPILTPCNGRQPNSRNIWAARLPGASRSVGEGVTAEEMPLAETASRCIDRMSGMATNHLRDTLCSRG